MDTGVMAYVLFAGAAIGFGCGYAMFHARFEARKATHAQEVKELKEEIARARAQVARLVGAEPKPISMEEPVRPRLAA